MNLRETSRWFSARFREVFQNPGSITIAIATAKHFIEALILLYTSSADGSVGIAAMLSVMPHLTFISREYLLADVMLISAAVSLYSAHSKTLHYKVGAVLLVPQQALLAVACIGAAKAVIFGCYANDYVPPVDHPSLFILGDQCIRLLLAPGYTIAIFARLTWYGGGRFGVAGG